MGANPVSWPCMFVTMSLCTGGGRAAKLHAPDMLEQRGLNFQWKGGVPDEILDAVFRACDTDDDGALCPRHQCP